MIFNVIIYLKHCFPVYTFLIRVIILDLSALYLFSLDCGLNLAVTWLRVTIIVYFYVFKQQLLWSNFDSLDSNSKQK